MTTVDLNLIRSILFEFLAHGLCSKDIEDILAEMGCAKISQVPTEKYSVLLRVAWARVPGTELK